MQPHKQYHNIAVEKGGLVDRYVEKVYETHDCKTREEALEVVIETFDPLWEFLDEGPQGILVEPPEQPELFDSDLR